MGKKPKDILAKIKRGDKGSLTRLKQNIKTNEKYQLNNFDLITWFLVTVKFRIKTTSPILIKKLKGYQVKMERMTENEIEQFAIELLERSAGNGLGVQWAKHPHFQ
ncbi:MAG: hypothetical protein LWX51_06885 [Deltaproteobacteria bacterium]|jgi:hypothetical protein|nr:hypothetical protein [Deltaproteobacteria bacterium]